MIKIDRIEQFPDAPIASLIEQSETEGFHFLVRLRDEWRSGSNRFAETSEAFFGGVTRSGDRIGRLRRFYVDKDYRRQGLGRTLVARIIDHAASHFKVVQLY